MKWYLDRCTTDRGHREKDESGVEVLYYTVHGARVGGYRTVL